MPLTIAERVRRYRRHHPNLVRFQCFISRRTRDQLDRARRHHGKTLAQLIERAVDLLDAEMLPPPSANEDNTIYKHHPDARPAAAVPQERGAREAAGAAAAGTHTAGSASAMRNPYGITLDRDVAHWAAERALSETVAAALQLIAKKQHPVATIAAKLTSTELDQVITVVRSWCNEHAFPRGVLAALEGQTAHSLACSYASAGNRGHGRGSAG
jgi:hypothetical protein